MTESRRSGERLLFGQAAGGGALGVASLGLMVCMDTGGLGSLLLVSADGLVATAMLCAGFGGMFAAGAVASALSQVPQG
jgi:hypothetical protein